MLKFLVILPALLSSGISVADECEDSNIYIEKTCKFESSSLGNYTGYRLVTKGINARTGSVIWERDGKIFFDDFGSDGLDALTKCERAK